MKIMKSIQELLVSNKKIRREMFEDQYGYDIDTAAKSYKNLKGTGVLGDPITIYTADYNLSEEIRMQFTTYTLSPDKLCLQGMDISDRVAQKFIAKKYMSVFDSLQYKIATTDKTK